MGVSPPALLAILGGLLCIISFADPQKCSADSSVASLLGETDDSYTVTLELSDDRKPPGKNISGALEIHNNLVVRYAEAVEIWSVDAVSRKLTMDFKCLKHGAGMCPSREGCTATRSIDSSSIQLFEAAWNELSQVAENRAESCEKSVEQSRKHASTTDALANLKIAISSQLFPGKSFSKAEKIMQATIAKLNKDIEDIRSTSETYSNGLFRYMELHKISSSEAQRLKSDLAHANSSLGALGLELKTVTDSLSKLETQYSTDMKMNSAKIVDLNQQIASLNQQLADATASHGVQLGKLRNSHEEALKNNNNACTELKRRETANLNQQIASLKQQLADAAASEKKNVSQARAEGEASQRAVCSEELKRMRSEREDALNSANNSCAELKRREVAKLNQQMASLKQQLADATASHGVQLGKLRNSHEEALKNNNNACTELKRRETASLNQQIADLKQQLADAAASEKKNVSQARAEGEASQRAACSEREDALSRANNTCADRIRVSDARISELAGQLEAAKASASLQSSQARKKGGCKAMKQMLEQKNSELRQKDDELRKKDDELGIVKDELDNKIGLLTQKEMIITRNAETITTCNDIITSLGRRCGSSSYPRAFQGTH